MDMKKRRTTIPKNIENYRLFVFDFHGTIAVDSSAIRKIKKRIKDFYKLKHEDEGEFNPRQDDKEKEIEEPKRLYLQLLNEMYDTPYRISPKEIMPDIESLITFTEQYKFKLDVYFGVATAGETALFMRDAIQFCYTKTPGATYFPFISDYLIGNPKVGAFLRSQGQKLDGKVSYIKLLMQIIADKNQDQLRYDEVMMIDNEIDVLNYIKNKRGEEEDIQIATYHVPDGFKGFIEPASIQCIVCSSAAKYRTDNLERLPFCGRQCLRTHYSKQ